MRDFPDIAIGNIYKFQIKVVDGEARTISPTDEGRQNSGDRKMRPVGFRCRYSIMHVSETDIGDLDLLFSRKRCVIRHSMGLGPYLTEAYMPLFSTYVAPIEYYGFGLVV